MGKMEEKCSGSGVAREARAARRACGRPQRPIRVSPHPVPEIRIPWDDSLVRLLAGHVRDLVGQRVFTVESGLIRVNHHEPRMACDPEPDPGHLGM